MKTKILVVAVLWFISLIQSITPVLAFDATDVMSSLPIVNAIEEQYSSREQYLIGKVIWQVDIIVGNVKDPQAKIQKSFDVAVFMLDHFVSKMKQKNNLTSPQSKSQLKILSAVLEKISEKYDTMSLQNTDNQNMDQTLSDTVKNKMNEINMIENSLNTYGLEINNVTKTYLGLSTSEILQHMRVMRFMSWMSWYEEIIWDMSTENIWEEVVWYENQSTQYLQNTIKNIVLQNNDKNSIDAYSSAVEELEIWSDIYMYAFDIIMNLQPVDNSLINSFQTRISSVQTRAQDIKVKADLMQLWSALAIYNLDYNEFPNGDLDKNLVEKNDYIIIMPTPEEGSYYYSPLINKKQKNGAMMLMGQVRDIENANWIDVDGVYGTDKSYNTIEKSVLEKKQCEVITYSDKVDQTKCTITDDDAWKELLRYVYFQ